MSHMDTAVGMRFHVATADMLKKEKEKARKRKPRRKGEARVPLFCSFFLGYRPVAVSW